MALSKRHNHCLGHIFCSLYYKIHIPSNMAQRKRAGLITRRALDRNEVLLSEQVRFGSPPFFLSSFYFPYKVKITCVTLAR